MTFFEQFLIVAASESIRRRRLSWNQTQEIARFLRFASGEVNAIIFTQLQRPN